MNPVTVREYDYLICEDDGRADDLHSYRWSKNIPESAYKYLERLLFQDEEKEQSDDHSFFLKRTSRNRRPALQLQSYVGVLQTPCGTQIEILPKTADGTDSGNQQSRDMLFRMLRHLRGASFKLGGDANLRHAHMHLLEIFITYFLKEVNLLVKKGVRSEYVAREENQAFLKGKLLINQHIRVNAVQQQRFYVSYDEYLPDRPENRLIHAALEKVSRLSRSADNQRLSRELMFVFDDVPVSQDVRKDFSQCKFNRAMVHYRHPLEWCRLILNEQSTVSAAGKTQTISILFPMEKIFEDYVAAMLRRNLSPKGYQIITQASGKHLCIEPKKLFQLRPDILIKKKGSDGEEDKCWVADTKWKLIDASVAKHGISQGDMYQLYAYGKKYENEGCEGLFLIYPEVSGFKNEAAYKFEDNLGLKCLPFSCDKDKAESFSIVLEESASDYKSGEGCT